MADVAQWSIDQFYSAIQSVWALANKAKSDLGANRTTLMRLWDVTKTQAPDVAKKHQAVLTPLIHNNSVLRTQYLAPLMEKYKSAVNAGSGALRQAGFTAPTLAGPPATLGFIPVVPLVAIAAIIVALSAASVLNNWIATQRKNTDAAAAIIGDKTLTPAQRTAELDALARTTKAAADAAARTNPLKGFNLDDMVPVLGLLAAILIVPKLLPLLPRRGNA